MPRTGSEAQAAHRLTANVEPADARNVLIRCLTGEVGAAAAVAELLHLTGTASTVRELVDTVTHNAAVASRSGDRLLQDRVDELTQLVVDPEAGVDRLEALRRRATST